MDHANFNEKKSTTGVASFGPAPYAEAKHADTLRFDDSGWFDMISHSHSPDGINGQLTSVSSSKDSNNNDSLDDNDNFSMPLDSPNPTCNFSDDREAQLLVDGVISTLMRAPKKRQAFKHNMDTINKVNRRPRCGRSLFGRERDDVPSADGYDMIYPLERRIPDSPLDEEFTMCDLSQDEDFSLNAVQMSARPLNCIPVPRMNFLDQRNSFNSHENNGRRADDIRSSDNKNLYDSAGEDSNDVPGRSKESSADLSSDEENLTRQVTVTPSRSQVSDDDNSNHRVSAEEESDTELQRPRLLPEHYIAPRRHRRIPLSVRAGLTAMRARRLSFNTCDEDSNHQQVKSDGADLYLPAEASSPHTCLRSGQPASNQNARRRLFDNDDTSLRKSFYTFILPNNNPNLSTRIDEATIQSILNTLLGSTCSENSCQQQFRPQSPLLSDDSQDLASSGDDCSVSNFNSDSDSDTDDTMNDNDSSDDELIRAACESVHFLPKSQFNSEVDTSSLRLFDNLDNWAVESVDSDNESTALYNSNDEDCSNADDTFKDLSSSEDDSRSHAVKSPSFTPVTTHTMNRLRGVPEIDSDTEDEGERHHPGQCAAPRRQSRLPTSRRTRFAPMSRRRLCFDDCDEETNNQRAISENSSDVSQSDINRSRLFPCNNKYAYALDPYYNNSGKAGQVDIASIQSVLNRFFNFSSCDIWSSSQSNLNDDTLSETDLTHSLAQFSFTANSLRLSNNDSHNSFNESMKTKSPSNSPSTSNSLYQDMSHSNSPSTSNSLYQDMSHSNSPSTSNSLYQNMSHSNSSSTSNSLYQDMSHSNSPSISNSLYQDMFHSNSPSTSNSLYQDMSHSNSPSFSNSLYQDMSHSNSPSTSNSEDSLDQDMSPSNSSSTSNSEDSLDQDMSHSNSPSTSNSGDSLDQDMSPSNSSSTSNSGDSLDQNLSQ